MRIVKELTIEGIHIAIFKMENRFTMKLEWNRMEQVFKLDGRENVNDLHGVLALISEEFINGTQKVFTLMSNHKNKSLLSIQEVEGEDFPEII